MLHGRIWHTKKQNKGIGYLRKAAAGGNSYAFNVLAHLYRSGDGVGKSKIKALVSYKRAKDAGYQFASLYLGEMYRNGEGVAVDTKKSIHHFKISASREMKDAHWNLARIYESEEGYLNEDLALYHFRLAADLGHIGAKEVVGEYFVSVSSPRKLSLTNNELQCFYEGSNRYILNETMTLETFWHRKG